MNLEEKNKFDIIIAHVPTWDKDDPNSQSIINFSPFLEAFSDNYKSTWDSKQTMGRMDNISTFKQTTRVINLSFTVPSVSEEDAYANYNKSKRLSDFLYPVYKTIKNDPKQNGNNVPNDLNQATLAPTVQNLYKASKLATTLEQQLNLRDSVSIMSAPPILKMYLSNLIQNRQGDDGLYGYLDGFVMKPDLDSGFYVQKQRGDLIPKVFSVELTFNVIHEEALGWTIDNKRRKEGRFYK